MTTAGEGGACSSCRTSGHHQSAYSMSQAAAERRSRQGVGGLTWGRDGGRSRVSLINQEKKCAPRASEQISVLTPGGSGESVALRFLECLATPVIE